MSACHSCGQERDLSPLPLSEVLSVIADAMQVAGDPVLALDLIAVRARSSVARLQIARQAVELLATAGRRLDVLGVLREEATIAALDESLDGPLAEEPES